jgi:hypothetical protein
MKRKKKSKHWERGGQVARRRGGAYRMAREKVARHRSSAGSMTAKSLLTRGGERRPNERMICRRVNGRRSRGGKNFLKVEGEGFRELQYLVGCTTKVKTRGAENPGMQKVEL